MNLRIELNNQDLANLGTGVIVEGWDKRNFGRGQRQYRATFTEAERAKLSKLYPMLYDWNMRSGLPQSHIFHTDDTIQLLQRAANFFGGL